MLSKKKYEKNISIQLLIVGHGNLTKLKEKKRSLIKLQNNKINEIKNLPVYIKNNKRSKKKWKKKNSVLTLRSNLYIQIKH